MGQINFTSHPSLCMENTVSCFQNWSTKSACPALGPCKQNVVATIERLVHCVVQIYRGVQTPDHVFTECTLLFSLPKLAKAKLPLYSQLRVYWDK